MTCPLDVPHGDLTFVLKDEPSRTHADQMRAAEAVRESMEALLRALDAGGKPSKARQDDPTWVLALNDEGSAAWIRNRRDGKIRMTTTSHDGMWTNATCVVEGTFRTPTAARCRRAAKMFLAAVEQMADTARGRLATLDLQQLAVARMMEGSGESVLTAPLPWKEAMSVRTGNTDSGWFGDEETMPDRCVASLVCTDTANGTLMEIGPMTVRVRADDVGVLDVMRAIQEVTARRENPPCSV